MTFKSDLYEYVTSGAREIKVEKGLVNDTVEALSVLNPIFGDDHFREEIYRMIRQYGEKSAHFGTMGFNIACFDGYDGHRYADVSIAPHLVVRYLRDKKVLAWTAKNVR